MPETNKLSEREQEILKLVATGLTNREIAQELTISPNTVKVHLRNIFEKINVSSRTEATLYGMEHGIVDVPGSEENSTEPAALNMVQRLPWAFVAILLVIVVVVAVGSNLLFPSPESNSNPEATTPDRWQELTPMPEAKSGMAAAAYSGNIYAIAGEGVEGVSGSVFRYITAEDRWEQLSDKPTPVADVKAVLIGEKIYVPGGRLEDGSPTDVLEVYDPRRESWEQKTPLPVKVSGYALADFEGQIYLFGGWDGEKVLGTALRYDPQDDQWDYLTPMPTARAYAGAAEAGGKIYVIGGWDGENELDVNESYAPARAGVDDTVWQDENPIPNKGYGYSMHSIAEMIFLLDESGIWQYNTQEKSWTLISTKVSDFSPNSVGITGYQGDLFIFGGSYNNRKIVENWKFQMFFIIAIPAISK